MAHDLEHDWMIVAPWWKWTSPTDTVSGRTKAPVLQKYDSPNLVNAFLKNPQRCLRRTAEDFVHVAKSGTFTKDSKGRPRRFGIGTKTDLQVYDDMEESPRTLKVFLDTHKRFYLVVCDVRCDAAGFPKVARENICEAGFVVRRRLTESADEAVVKARQEFCATRSALRELDTKLASQRALHTPVQNALRSLTANRRAKALVKRRGFAQERFTAQQEALRMALLRFGVGTTHLHGWFAQLAPVNAASGVAVATAAVDNVGVWCDVEEEPITVGDETYLPLYPLIPPPADTEHAGRFGTTYFGLLPTGSRELDPQGRARFDDRTQYEVRCFVKRHLQPHAKGSPCPCPDGTFWSLPTEPYKLASHFDLIGTSHQPVTIQLPDLKELAAQAKPMPGVGFATPPGYPMVTGTSKGEPKSLGTAPDFQICSFPIPLITIVAKFVFEIFLPVVMLMFGLFWMLKLKLCIPPEVSVAGGIEAKAGLDGELDLNLEADFEVEAGLSLEDAVGQGIDKNFGLPSELAANLKGFAPVTVANMQLGLLKAGKNPPQVTTSLTFEDEVAHA